MKSNTLKQAGLFTATCLLMLSVMTGCAGTGSDNEPSVSETISSESGESATDQELSANTEEAADTKDTESSVDSEILRIQSLGLVNAKYMENLDAPATTKDLRGIIEKILEKQGADAEKVNEWKSVTNGSKEAVRTSDSMMAVYYAASLLSDDGIPKSTINDNGGSNRWTPADWDIGCDHFGMCEFLRMKDGSYSFYSAEEGWHGNDAVKENQSYGITSVMYSIGLASRLSGQYVFPNDPDTNCLYINNTLTRRELALQMVRFYDSFEPEAVYASIDDIAAVNPIDDAAIKDAAPVPSTKEKGYSSEWKGAYSHKYSEPGKDGGLTILGASTNYQESEFAALSDLGFNYLSLRIGCASLAYPDYGNDRSTVNQNIIDDIDRAIGWGLKYGIHIEISFDGFMDDDLKGYGYQYSDNIYTPDCLANTQQYQAKEALITAFAKRYANVPNDYLSFELSCENSAETHSYGISGLSSDEMADAFISIANSVWEVSPDRCVLISTCDRPDDANMAYWEKIAKAGINLDYHCYEPRSFVAPREHNHVDPDQMIWPGFVDENGTTWTMDDVYETYMKPYQDLADEAGVDFKVGESGMFLEGYDLFEESPRVEKYVEAWASDFTDCMKKNHTSYVIGDLIDGGNLPLLSILPPVEDDKSTYIKDAQYTLKTYKMDDYTASYYINEELAGKR